MSSMFVLFLIVFGCIFAAPIVHQSIEFNFLNCQTNENDTSAFYRIEIKDFNETCLQINKTTANMSEILFYIFQETQIRNLIEIKADDCLSPTPDFSITQCENDNSTGDYFYIINSNSSSNSTDESDPMFQQVIIQTEDQNSDESTKSLDNSSDEDH